MSEQIFLFSEVDGAAMLRLARAFSHLHGTCLLWSGSTFDSAEKSFLWAFPWDTISIRQGTIERQRASTSWKITPTDMWQALKDELVKTDNHVCNASWVGYFGYEMGFYAHEPLRPLLSQVARMPVAVDTADTVLARCCFEATYDHKKRELFISIDRTSVQLLSRPLKEICESLSKKKLQALLFDKEPFASLSSSFEVIKPFESLSSYTQKVEHVHDSIFSGDVYQLNLSSHIVLKGRCPPFDLFVELVRKNEASFFSFLKLKDYAIVSASPERFLKRRSLLLESRPIKGTRPRGKTEREDQELERELAVSEKEASELVMIVDLMRNDLSRVCLPGTVVVKEFCIEAYRYLFHRLAIIEAKSRELHPVDILRLAFPGGSVTGCPKISAMQKIFELEGRKRGVYTGSIGYITPEGDFDFNIAIRTAVMNSSFLTFAVGSGIVIDSNPYQEYEETLTKAKSLLDALSIHGKVV